MTTVLGDISVQSFSDSAIESKKVSFDFSSVLAGATSSIVLPANSRIITLPDASTTLVGTDTSQILTNKTIDASINTISNITNASIDASAAISGSKISGDIAGNAANVTGIVAVANGGTGSSTAANARTALSAAQSGVNADITSLTQTTAIDLKGASNSVTLQAHAATAAWTLTLPTSAGSNNQVLKTNGSGMTSWTTIVGAGSSLPSLGNVAIVDAVNGNDGTATVGGTPFLTITAALAAVAAGQQVWIMPGTYSEVLIIPASVHVRGISVGAVVIQQLAVVANTTLITMGSNSRLEDITLTLTSATAGLTLKGVEFPGTTPESARLRSCMLNVSNTSVGNGTLYGIHVSGTGGFAMDCIRASTINVSGSVTTKAVGIYSNNASSFCFRDSIVLVQRTAGAGLYYGIETNNAGSVVICRHSTVFGTSSDISQTLGNIHLANVTLQNNSTNSLPFTSLDSCKTMTFCIIGASSNASTRYLRICGAESTNEILHNIPTNVIVKKMHVRSRTTITSPQTVVITLRKNLLILDLQ